MGGLVISFMLTLVLALATLAARVHGDTAAQGPPPRAESHPPLPDSASLASFFRWSYGNHAQGIREKLGPRYREICQALGIPDSSARNREALLPLLYYHALLTSTDARDCRTGGALGTSYMWHWVSPNPRHALRRLPDSTLLTRLPPPAGFGKYKSWADVDRLPSLYLGDLASEKPRYHHPLCGEVLTFGWCSEREMAFGALMAELGEASKIKQEGIHVWSELMLPLTGADGAERLYVLALDHTFDTAQAWPLRVSRAAWARDYGDGAQVGWYNKVIRSREQLDKVKAIRPGEGARRRMIFQMLAWMGYGR